MVYLYGVVHGGEWKEFFGRSGEMRIYPSRELFEDLKKFPRGTKVGIENLSAQDWKEVRSHLATLPFNPPAPIVYEEDRWPAERPVYSLSGEAYWKELIDMCSALGFETVFLEKKDAWLKYNEAIIKHVENEENRHNLLFFEKGESDEHYDRKRIGFNSNRHKEKILIRKIHEIERENQILDKIKSCGANLAFVGLGHSNEWIANLQKGVNIGIKIDGYSTEIPQEEGGFYSRPMIFTKEGKLDFRLNFERNNLERQITLIENGRLDERKPDFVGTWDVHVPAKGYFEMFMNRDGENIEGEIVDCLGCADFKGELSNGRIEFVKRYRPLLGKEREDIPYKGIVRDQNAMGYFIMGKFATPFCMTSQFNGDFVDLGVSWSLLTRRYKKGITSLGKRLFDKIDN